METNCAVLSPQEYRLQEEQAGRDIYTGRMRPYKILKSIQTLRPIIDVERARYFTESMKQTEGQMLILRWAKAMQIDLSDLDNLTRFVLHMESDAGVQAALKAEGLA